MGKIDNVEYPDGFLDKVNKLKNLACLIKKKPKYYAYVSGGVGLLLIVFGIFVILNVLLSAYDFLGVSLILLGVLMCIVNPHRYYRLLDKQKEEYMEKLECITMSFFNE